MIIGGCVAALGMERAGEVQGWVRGAGMRWWKFWRPGREVAKGPRPQYSRFASALLDLGDHSKVRPEPDSRPGSRDPLFSTALGKKGTATLQLISKVLNSSSPFRGGTPKKAVPQGCWAWESFQVEVRVRLLQPYRMGFLPSNHSSGLGPSGSEAHTPTFTVVTRYMWEGDTTSQAKSQGQWTSPFPKGE